MNTKISRESRINSFFSYFFIFSVILYITKKDDKFVQFHARQGIVVFVLMIIGLFPVLGVPLFILSIVLAVIGASKAYVGEEFKIPFIYKYANKIDF